MAFKCTKYYHWKYLQNAKNSIQLRGKLKVVQLLVLNSKPAPKMGRHYLTFICWHITHLSHLGGYVEFSSFHIQIMFCFSHTKQFYVKCKGGHCMEIPETCTCDLVVWISKVLEIIGHFLFKALRPWSQLVWSWLHTCIIICFVTQGTIGRDINVVQ
jgi:hypothetical protein